MKNGEPSKKPGTTQTATPGGSASRSSVAAKDAADKQGDATKKRFGKGKAPAPAPRQPRARQRLSVTVLGAPDGERPIFEDPLLLDLQAGVEASATSVLEVPFDLSWPPPIDAESGLVDLSWPAPAVADTTPKNAPARTKPAADDEAAILEAQLDLTWPLPDATPDATADTVPSATTTDEPASDDDDQMHDVWPSAHALDIPVDLRTPPPVPVAEAPPVEVAALASVEIRVDTSPTPPVAAPKPRPAARMSQVVAPAAGPAPGTPAPERPARRIAAPTTPQASPAPAPIAAVPTRPARPARPAAPQVSATTAPAAAPVGATPRAPERPTRAPRPAPTPTAAVATVVAPPVRAARPAPTPAPHVPVVTPAPEPVVERPRVQRPARVAQTPVPVPAAEPVATIAPELIVTPLAETVPHVELPPVAGPIVAEVIQAPPIETPVAEIVEAPPVEAPTTPVAEVIAPAEPQTVEPPVGVASEIREKAAPARRPRTRRPSRTTAEQLEPTAVTPEPVPVPEPVAEPILVVEPIDLIDLAPPVEAPPAQTEIVIATPEDAPTATTPPGWPSFGEFAKPGAVDKASAPSEPAEEVAPTEGFRTYQAVYERTALRGDDETQAAADQLAREDAWERAAEADDATPEIVVVSHFLSQTATPPPAQPVETETSGTEWPIAFEPVQKGELEAADEVEMVIETPRSLDLAEQPHWSDQEWLDARLEAAERELHRLAKRTKGQDGDLRNARRREIAEAVRMVLDDGELTPHFDLLMGNGRLEFHRRGPGLSNTTGEIRRLSTDDGDDSRPLGPQVKPSRAVHAHKID